MAWLNRKHILIIAFFAFIPFFFYLFFPTLLGADSFYFYVVSCDGASGGDIPLLSRIFFDLMPCNLTAFKYLSFFVLLVSSLIVAKTGELFNKQFGWTAGVFVFISIAWVHFHVQIEDDLLAYPVLFLANYFFLKGQLNKDNGRKLFAVVLVVFTGALIWKGALLYLVAYTFFFVTSLVILYASLYYIGFGAMHALLGNDLIQENMNAFLLSTLGPRTLGLGHGLGLIGLYLFTRRQFLFVPFLIAMLFNAKWAIHLSPFLGIGIMLMVSDLHGFVLRKGIVFKEWYANKHFKEMFLVLALFSTIALGVGLLFQSPNPSQLEAVQFAVEEAQGEKIDNDWSYGYYIMFFGGDTNTFGGGWPRYTASYNDKILLTENPRPFPTCRILRIWYGGGFYGSDIFVYNCEK